MLGLGTDLVDVVRVDNALQRHGDRFRARVFTPEEIAYCEGRARPGPHYAARFAAKEAVSKALGTGICGAFPWKAVAVAKRASGEPYAVLDETGQALVNRLGGETVLITLAHTATLATATALLVG